MWAPLRSLRRAARRRTSHLKQLAVLLLVTSILFLVSRHGGLMARIPGVLLSVREGALEVYFSRASLEVLTGALGLRFEIDTRWQECEHSGRDRTTCLLWVNKARFNLTHRMVKSSDQLIEPYPCYTVTWESLHPSEKPMDCYNLGEASWYGGAETWHQHWPINQESISLQPYISSDQADHGAYGRVMERYWLSSQGIAMYVDETVPLHVGISGNKLCLMADHSSSRHVSHLPAVLKYHICVHKNVRAIHDRMVGTLWPLPGGPSYKGLQLTWSTTTLGENMKQRDVEDLAAAVLLHTGIAGRIDLNHKFFTNIGDYEVSPSRFPSLKKMLGKLHAQGFKVYPWHTPYADGKSNAFDASTTRFVHNRGLVMTGPYPYGKIASTIDFTSQDAVGWQSDILANLLKGHNKFDGLSIEGGYSFYFPQSFNTSLPLANPNFYAQAYVAAMHDLTNGHLESGVGYRTQYLPVCVHLSPRASTWDKNGGLLTIIPAVLTMGLIGYPCVIPGAVGGESEIPPSVELYKRWVALAAFLPAMRFHHFPWSYKDATVMDHVQRMVHLHADWVSPRLKLLSQEGVKTGYPLIRPLWWVDPTNEETYNIDSEFLIGDDILVAPILKPGQTKRDIYLPQGRWKDMLHKFTVYDGGQYIKEYVIEINEIAYFERVDRETL